MKRRSSTCGLRLMALCFLLSIALASQAGAASVIDFNDVDQTDVLIELHFCREPDFRAEARLCRHVCVGRHQPEQQWDE